MNNKIVSTIAIIIVTTLILSSCLTFVKAEDNTISNESEVNTLTLNDQVNQVQEELKNAEEQLEYVQEELGEFVVQIQEMDDKINEYQKQLDDINKTDKEKLEFAKIIRDADKIANIYRINFINYVKQPVNRDALEELFSQTLVSYKNMTNSIDQILTCFSYIYDLAYNESVKIIIKEHLLEPLVEKIKLFSDISDEDYQKIINIIEKFKFQS